SAGRAKQRKDFAATDFEIHPLQSRDAGGIGLGYAGDGDDRRHVMKGFNHEGKLLVQCYVGTGKPCSMPLLTYPAISWPACSPHGIRRPPDAAYWGGGCCCGSSRGLMMGVFPSS